MLYFLYNINYHLPTLQYNITLSCFFFFYQLVKTRTMHFRFYYCTTVLLGKLLSIRITKLCCCKNHSPCFSAFNKEDFFLSFSSLHSSFLPLSLSLSFFSFSLFHATFIMSQLEDFSHLVKGPPSQMLSTSVLTDKTSCS